MYNVTCLMMLCDLFSLQLVFHYCLPACCKTPLLTGTGPLSVPFAGPIASNERDELHL